MRHGVKLNHLGRTASHRHALLSGLACQLILNKRIVTTLAKAKSLRVYAEPLITKSKTNTTHQRRVVFSYLNDKDAVTELFSTVSEKIAARPGGYTRIIKLGKRLGDAAEMALIELVDFNEVYSNVAPAAGKKKRTRRSAGGGKKKASEQDETGTEDTPPVKSKTKNTDDTSDEKTAETKQEKTEAKKHNDDKEVAEDKTEKEQGEKETEA